MSPYTLAPSVHIALDAQLLSRAASFRTGGISRVIYYLLRELARDARGHTFDVFLPEAPFADDPMAAGSLRFHVTGAATIRPSVRIRWEQTILPLRLARVRPDLLHALAYATPLLWTGASVVTMYDMSFRRFPRAFNGGNRLYLSLATRFAARTARRVLTISNHSRSDIARFLGLPESRIDVAYPAADAHYRRLEPDAVRQFRQGKALPDDFIFSVGTLEPRKNLTGLLDAYARLPLPRPPLYIAGAAGWRFDPIFDKVRGLRLEGNVHFLGFVPESELPHWYNAARLFAYPSLYEGFGLPVLEALACGAPVIASNAASIPEVTGTAAILVPPGDAESLARQMQRVLQDTGLRQALSAAGEQQARSFSWARTADATVASYERAVAGSAA